MDDSLRLTRQGAFVVREGPDNSERTDDAERPRKTQRPDLDELFASMKCKQLDAQAPKLTADLRRPP